MIEPIIQLIDVTKDFRYRGRFAHPKALQVLKGVNFSLYPGRTLALVGESGSGKSTCARLIVKMQSVTDGKILFKGKDIAGIKSRKEIKEYRSSVQMVFQDPFSSLNPAHSIRHHLTRPLKIHHPKTNKFVSVDQLESLLKMVGLPNDTLQKFPHQLSGGQKQRVNLARAIAVGSEVILADEPTSMLDVSVRLEILNLMQEMKKKLGIGFLYITHDLVTAHTIADETAVMFQGQIVEWGDTHSIIANPQHPYTRLLIDAIPDPDSPFSELIKNNVIFGETAEKIRLISTEKQSQCLQAGPNHFVRKWQTAA